jgi:hypothetical protein
MCAPVASGSVGMGWTSVRPMLWWKSEISDGELADSPMLKSQEPYLKIKKLPGANRDIHEIREAALW